MGGPDGRAGGVWAWVGRDRLMFRMMALLYSALADSANRPVSARHIPFKARSGSLRQNLS
jgi:hypothetical protein